MDKILSVAIEELMPDPTQPRKSFLDEEIERLAASIRARGILMPLRILRDEERRCWLIATGESRWRAARLAGLKTVPCIVVDGQPDEADLLADRVIENHVRHDLSAMDLARALAKLKLLKKCTSQQLAKELGISGAAITRAEALLSLPEDVQTLVESRAVPESTAYEISRMPDADSQRELAAAVADRRLKRDAVANAVRDRIGKRAVKPKAGRVVCRLGGGLSISISANDALDWTTIIEAIDRIRREARKLSDNGSEVQALARSLRAS
ncbi:ParB/RepB/Spo0J family partition protein [Paludisphaera borealis]|uniref:Nucleoid occlusion protein n=1 Tax=Paludisphaera borealis TaxID=1387353 RepID=A0A1U7CI68_9BACT|nr:ParB/RepB/Spo0J family partition protein [Paludisphaera borealis]APW58635.1 Nucleoid occlusion protein [Paludisphaera borealis]